MESVVTDPHEYKTGDLLTNAYIGEQSFNGYEHNRLFRNDGDRTFSEVAVGLGIDAVEDGRSSIFFDMDNDGDLDLFVTNMNQPSRLFRNERGNERNWIKIRPVGAGSNRGAIGATVRVTANGKTMIRPVLAGQGFQTSYYGPVHFGLADATRVERVEVTFPDGSTQVLRDVEANQVVRVYAEEDAQTAAR